MRSGPHPTKKDWPDIKRGTANGLAEAVHDHRPGDMVEVVIERIVPNGFGLAFADELTIFVALSAPGDRVRARLTKLKGTTAFAEIEVILEPSPFRVPPNCNYFGTCGGCDFQHIPYERQLSIKAEMLTDSLRRIGRLEVDELPIIASPKRSGYRTRALWRADLQSNSFGYYKRDSHEIVDIDHCPVLDERLDTVMQELRSSMRVGKVKGNKASFEASVGSAGRPSVFSPDANLKCDEILIEAGGERYWSNAHTFFQGNLSLLDELIGAATNDSYGSFALDLYCGVGLFSLPLARRFANVVGVESDHRSIDLARRNAIAAEAENINFYVSGVGAFLANFEGPPLDLVLLDPPRAGTEKNVIRDVIKLGPKNVTYVACDGAVLARDLRRLVDGGYDIEHLVALDMFPQTHHVEAVARLRRAI